MATPPPIVVEVEPTPPAPNGMARNGLALNDHDSHSKAPSSSEPVRPYSATHSLAVEAEIIHDKPSSSSKVAARGEYRKAREASKRQEHAIALTHYIKANEAVPGAEPKFRIAEALDKLGRTRDAIIAYHWFVASNPSERYTTKIDRAKQRIEELER